MRYVGDVRYDPPVKRIIGVIAFVIVTAIGAAGCGMQSALPAKTETVTVAPKVTDLDEMIVSNASALATMLTDHGVECTLKEKPSSGPKASLGTCEIPAADGSDGVPIILWVWKSAGEAMSGLALWLSVSTVRGRHYISGANWIIDFNNYNVAAGQVQGALRGGTLHEAGTS